MTSRGALVVASRKVLKSVARSLADSFTSLMNFVEADYVMGHILTAAWTSGRSTLEVNLLSHQASPEELLTDPVQRSICSYCEYFLRLVTSSGSDPAYVAAASVRIQFDLAASTPHPKMTAVLQSPYVCTVRLQDDQGKVYESALNGWWYPEP